MRCGRGQLSPVRVAERSPVTRHEPGRRTTSAFALSATAWAPQPASRPVHLIQPHIFFFAGIITPFLLTMALVPQGGPSNAMSREGSRTALMVQDANQRDVSAASMSELAVGLAPAGTLRLRGAQRDGPHVAWNEDVVDNEGLGRKKSKSTCFNCKGRIW